MVRFHLTNDGDIQQDELLADHEHVFVCAAAATTAPWIENDVELLVDLTLPTTAIIQVIRAVRIFAKEPTLPRSYATRRYMELTIEFVERHNTLPIEK